MIMFAKEPYTPSPDKRFEISKDPYSRERAHLIGDVVQELRDLIPEVRLGFTLMGSLAKGKKLTAESAVGADIDLFAFVDADDVLVSPYEMDLEDQYRDMRVNIAAEMRGQASPPLRPGDNIDTYVQQYISHAFSYPPINQRHVRHQGKADCRSWRSFVIWYD